MKDHAHLASETGWIWMPHAAHFCLSARCQFRLATYVNGVIVSTVGELLAPDGETFDYVGGRGAETTSAMYYETGVFRAVRSDDCLACPYDADVSEDLDGQRYATAKEAYEGHMAYCRKWGTLREEAASVPVAELPDFLRTRGITPE